MLNDISKSFFGKKVLITGHTGFKGSWLSLWLKQLGATVYESDTVSLKEVNFKTPLPPLPMCPRESLCPRAAAAAAPHQPAAAWTPIRRHRFQAA